MGFFDKKYCDVCGNKIGLLGNRKLEDGNLCKDCAAKLSPFFSDRRHSTLEEIKEPEGYNKLAEEVPVTVDAGNSTRADVENQSGNELPSTGGMGTTIFYAVGAALLVGAGIVLVTRRRMGAER